MNPLYAAMPVSIFERMSFAAAAHGAVNLGQGFPDFGWPEPLVAEAARLLTRGSNQYPPSRGLPALRQAVADHYARHQGLDLSADNVLVTSGATEAIAAALFALLEPGDEAIVIAPAYDAYAPLIRRAGGVIREVALRPPQWRIDEGELAAAVSPRTRLIVLNNPHNPTGRLFDAAELAAVARVADRHDLLVLSDEVWEHVLPEGRAFVPFASLPGMAARTLKCGSAGKIFSLTGWKVGWLVAPPELAALAAKAHQFLTFATAPNLQAAVAVGLGHDEWLAPMRAAFTAARDRLADGLAAAGYVLLPSEGTYFQCVDLAASGIALDDQAFATLAVERAGVAVIPLSPFYEEAPATNLVRLCFAKRDETIAAGLAAMAKARDLARG
ncbi:MULTISPECIES: aminotransferase [Sphingomonas]|uniref:aminotransferase n=1 Tax=Sphingomonas TaxID=13687 RepID=UPI000DF0192E|nr:MULTISPECIES: aminotransferase [Sphingomonas]